MLATVAALIILLGLMVSLARYVRDRSAQQLTRQLLKQLEALMVQYIERNGGKPPPVASILSVDAPAALTDETAIAASAKLNNEQCVGFLAADYRLRLKLLQAQPVAQAADPFEQLPISVYDGKTLRDAWGSPIVFMPGQHQLIGMAPSRGGQDQFFFFSAGPDRKYLTRDDNLYSYETPGNQ